MSVRPSEYSRLVYYIKQFLFDRQYLANQRIEFSILEKLYFGILKVLGYFILNKVFGWLCPLIPRCYGRSNLLYTYSSIAQKPINIRWIRTSNTEIPCIAPNYRQFFTNIKIKITKLIPVLVDPGPLELTKLDQFYNFLF